MGKCLTSSIVFFPVIANICYDGKEHNGKLQKSKWNAKIQVLLLAYSRLIVILCHYIETKSISFYASGA
jgi:hypothetical protein